MAVDRHTLKAGSVGTVVVSKWRSKLYPKKNKHCCLIKMTGQVR
jgi:hypothetical protein